MVKCRPQHAARFYLVVRHEPTLLDRQWVLGKQHPQSPASRFADHRAFAFHDPCWSTALVALTSREHRAIHVYFPETSPACRPFWPARVHESRRRVGAAVSAREPLEREIRLLRKRLSQLSTASVRISATLDLDTVLRETVESACSLTDSRYGVITTVDETGRVEEFVTVGLTDEVRRRILQWTEAIPLFEHLRDLPSPLRTTDIAGYFAELGFTSDFLPSGSLMGMPVRHCDTQVGNVWLADKGGGRAYSDADEHLLVLFASQAATAIANARTYRDEQRVRNNLEALVDTSPVGVVVFDPPTGHPLSFNREARRIASRLLLPGQTAVDLLGQATCRRGDGREFALDDPAIVRELSEGQTVRNEEIVLSVSDGRSVAILVNSTAIHSADGTLETVVITLQDLAPLEELDRMRAEFLWMVSHELRTPLSSIKGSATTLLESAGSLDPAEAMEFHRIIAQQADGMRRLIGDLLDAGRIDTGTLTVSPEPAELAVLVDGARMTFLSGGAGYDILVDLPPDLPRVMVDQRRIEQVLGNLFANAARHSPDTAPIRVAAALEGVHVAVSVRDGGAGIEPERLRHLFRKYARADGQGPERGVGGGLGLAICKGLVEAHGGRIRAESQGAGRGTTVTFTVPVAEEGDGAGAAAAPVRPAGLAPEGGNRTRVLVVDDDPQALRYVRDALTRAGHQAIVTGEHRELGRIIAAEKPDIVLLDLMLQDTDGIKLMQTVPELADLPVMFISAYGRDETIVRALESGARDYIVKPFSSSELVARISAALRERAGPARFRLGELEIGYEERQVFVSGREVVLTPTEFELLRALSLNAGRVSTFEMLMSRVWAGREHASPDLVRAFMKKLRKKLGENPKAPQWIFNRRGVGYTMVHPHRG